MKRFINRPGTLVITGCLIICLVALLFLRTLNPIYPEGQSDRWKDRPVRQSNKPESSSKIGQWVKYEVELSLPALTATSPADKQIIRYLVKRSLIGREGIDNHTYLREEYLILPARITYQLLTNSQTGTIKQIIFQRLGFPPMEIEPDKLPRLLGQIPALELITTDTQMETIAQQQPLQLISQEKTTSLLPESKKKLEVTWLTYSDASQTTRLMIWKSKDVPFTGVVKSVLIFKGTSITVTLLDFGLSGAQSSIIAQPIRFGDKIKSKCD